MVDWGVQATVSWVLSQCFSSENVSIVVEEDVETLSEKDNISLLESVVNTVNACLAESPTFGLEGPAKGLGTQVVLEAISRCDSNGAPKGNFWVLDPVDGMLGFVCGDQYAVALLVFSGCMMYAPKGRGKAWMQPLVNDYGNFDWQNCAQKIQVSSINDPALATFCEPAEKAN